MYINNVRRREECQHEAGLDLRKLGIKCRPKKTKIKQLPQRTHKLFKVPLEVLPKQTVTLISGQQITVPKLVHELCSFILTKVQTEGVFRKEGSKFRQNEIKLLLNAGGPLEDDHHVIDVAAVLKTFLRELPEPLIPFAYHELFLRCVLLDKNKLEATLLACLLLPMEHLNTLSYILQFLHQVADFSNYNKMNAYNLAVVIGPNAFPIEEKLSPNLKLRTDKTCELFKILIENSASVGFIPDDIIERVGNAIAHTQEEIDGKKKKKRRSGSLTRMFNGLKKIVGGKEKEDASSQLVTPDLLMTPVSHVLKKRRASHGNVAKKNKLPDNVLQAPFTPCRTPISMDLSGPKKTEFREMNEIVKEKKQWFGRSRSVKNLKQESDLTAKSTLERRWSAISNATNFKKLKKRNSCLASMPPPPAPSEPDYIRVPKTEYEEIKSRVSEMERQITLELEKQQTEVVENNNEVLTPPKNNNNIVKSVQTAYEQTLVQAEHLSPTTDQLAKRLSRELRIRRSAEQKIIRSPSARKIGSMRRRSRELEKNQSRLSRNQSWHVVSSNRSSLGSNGASLKRGKPNTVQSGLPQMVGMDLATKATSCDVSGSSCDTWVSAEGFFKTLKSTDSSSMSDNSRASLAKLRSQNAGMVLAKAKLFDQLKDTDSSNSSGGSSRNSNRRAPRVATGKIGSVRNHDARMSYRVRMLKYEEKRLGKKSLSPKSRRIELNKQKLQMAKKYLNDTTTSSISNVSSDKENISLNVVNSPKFQTPRMTPQIKRTLNVKSPKRLCRTPVGVDRSTPLRVIKTPGHYV